MPKRKAIKKPAKPYDSFPLYAHASGKWAKRIGPRIKYFGSWGDPQAALREYERYLAEQREGKTKSYFLTIADGWNLFLGAKLSLVDRDVLQPRTVTELKSTGRFFLAHFGRDRDVESFGPDDFLSYMRARQKVLGPQSMSNEIGRVRQFFKWLYDNDKLRAPMRFGTEFKKWSKVDQRRHKREVGAKTYTPQEIKNILEESGTHLRAFVLLGLNGAMYPADIGRMLRTDWDNMIDGMIDYPRAKNVADRQIWVWPETIEAVEATFECGRSANRSTQGLLFAQRDGKSWDTSTNPINKRFQSAKQYAGIRKGSFMFLRHTFETVSSSTADQTAIDYCMGHVGEGMSRRYLHGIEPARIRRVCESVRNWLFEDTVPRPRKRKKR